MTKKGMCETAVIYSSFMESTFEAGFTPVERGEFYDGLITYIFTGKLPKFTNPIMKAMFALCQPVVDASNQRYQSQQRARENGNKGGAPKGNTNACKSVNAKGKEKKVCSSATTEGKPAEPYEKTTQDTTEKTTLTKNKDKDENKNKEDIYIDIPEQMMEGEAALTDLEVRRNEFFESLKPYADIWGKENIQRFYDYWSQTAQDGTTMRFENEEYWTLSNRVGLWLSNTK